MRNFIQSKRPWVPVLGAVVGVTFVLTAPVPRLRNLGTQRRIPRQPSSSPIATSDLVAGLGIEPRRPFRASEF